MGLFWKCCPCSSKVIQGLIMGLIITALVLTVVLPIFLIGQQTTTTAATTEGKYIYMSVIPLIFIRK